MGIFKFSNVMKFLFRRAKKPIQDYNLESRTDKVLSLEKPKRAPMHPTTEKYYKEKIQNQTDDEKNRLFEADAALLDRLEHVYVKSAETQNPSFKSTRKMPHIRTSKELKMYLKYPHGKVTLIDITEMLTEHHNDPQLNTPIVLAEKFRLEVSEVENLIQYCNAFGFKAMKKPLLVADSPPESTGNVFSVLEEIDGQVKEAHEGKLKYEQKIRLQKAKIDADDKKQLEK